MKISHETLNSAGVVIAIIMGLSGAIQHYSAIPMIGRGSGAGEEKPEILINDESIFIKTHSKGHIKTLNTSNNRLYISITVRASKECPPNGSPINESDFYGQVYSGGSRNNIPGAWTSSPSGYDDWATTAVSSEQIAEVPWEVYVIRDPDVNGELCAIIETMLSDGNRSTLIYRVGFFSNIFNKNVEPKGFAQQLLDESSVLRNGNTSALTEKERLVLQKIGDDQFHGGMGHPGGTDFNLVPERHRLTLFGFEWWFLGPHVTTSY